MCGIVSCFNVYNNKETAYNDYNKFAIVYSFVLGTPTTREGEYCAFDMGEELVELFLIEDNDDQKTEYSIILRIMKKKYIMEESLRLEPLK